MGEPEPFFAIFYFWNFFYNSIVNKSKFKDLSISILTQIFPQVQYHGWEILDGLNSNKKQKFK